MSQSAHNSLRGPKVKTDEAEDARLGAELLASEKDRAEHIMLVDLARNDVNRVCAPETVQVDDLMRLEKFSHVIHITSQISGQLRPDQSRFDAFRSIFPAGTVSGAPKVKAIQLVGGLEQEKRGVYAGAVGRFDFDRDNLDTCIAIRTMTFMGGHVYLQAGGGIVFDSVEEDEWVETENKLKSNVSTIAAAESESKFPWRGLPSQLTTQSTTTTSSSSSSRPHDNDKNASRHIPIRRLEGLLRQAPPPELLARRVGLCAELADLVVVRSQTKDASLRADLAVLERVKVLALGLEAADVRLLYAALERAHLAREEAAVALAALVLGDRVEDVGRGELGPVDVVRHGALPGGAGRVELGAGREGVARVGLVGPCEHGRNDREQDEEEQ